VSYRRLPRSSAGSSRQISADVGNHREIETERGSAPATAVAASGLHLRATERLEQGPQPAPRNSVAYVLDSDLKARAHPHAYPQPDTATLREAQRVLEQSPQDPVQEPAVRADSVRCPRFEQQLELDSRTGHWLQARRDLFSSLAKVQPVDLRCHCAGLEARQALAHRPTVTDLEQWIESQELLEELIRLGEILNSLGHVFLQLVALILNLERLCTHRIGLGQQAGEPPSTITMRRACVSASSSTASSSESRSRNWPGSSCMMSRAVCGVHPLRSSEQSWGISPPPMILTGSAPLHTTRQE